MSACVIIRIMTIEDVQFTMQECCVDPETIRAVIERLQRAQQEEAEARAKEAEVRAAIGSPFPVCFLMGNDHASAPGFLVEPNGNVDGQAVPELIYQAVRQYNADERAKKKSRRAARRWKPIVTVGEAVERLPRKYFKALGIKVRHKGPMHFVTGSNDILLADVNSSSETP